jgi:quercetin dioxygenase-like cupin family protein
MNMKPAIIFAAAMAVPCITATAQNTNVQQRTGVTSAELFEKAIPNTENMEVTVLEVRYQPGGVNPRHFHPAAVTFYILEGRPIFREEGKEPVALKPGDTLLVPAGTTHAHWNPSTTEGVRWLEFIVAEKGKGRAIRRP